MALLLNRRLYYSIVSAARVRPPQGSLSLSPTFIKEFSERNCLDLIWSKRAECRLKVSWITGSRCIPVRRPFGLLASWENPREEERESIYISALSLSLSVDYNLRHLSFVDEG